MGYVKDAIYQEASTTKLDMTDTIRRTCQGGANTANTQRNPNFRHRLNLCLENNDTHFEHLIPRVIRNDN